MKANAPEKIWVHELAAMELNVPLKEYHVEYVRTDAFIEKVARFLENKLYDRVEIQVWGTIIPSLTSKKAFIDEFVNYMKGE